MESSDGNHGEKEASGSSKTFKYSMRSIAPSFMPYDDRSISKSDKDKPKEKKSTKPQITEKLSERYSDKKNTRTVDSDGLSSITEGSTIERYGYDYGERKEMEDEETNRLDNNSLFSIPTLKRPNFEVDKDKVNNNTIVDEGKNKPKVSNAVLNFNNFI